MIDDAAQNVRLKKQATALLQYYANQANHFRPALATVEKATGIPRNKISEIRKRIADHGLIAYSEAEEYIYIDWQHIRIYAALEKPLELRRKKCFFSPAKKPPRPAPTLGQDGKKYRIVNPRKLSPTEKQFYSKIESMTEEEFFAAMELLSGVNRGT